MDSTKPTVPEDHEPTNPGDARRGRPDRRQAPTDAWAALPPAGRRLRHRRAEEHQTPYFVDRFSQGTFILIMMLLLASMIDATLTVYLIEMGGDELNPVMDHLLDRGVMPFILGKYLLTVAGLPVLLIFQNHYLFQTRFRVRHLIPIAVALYGVLIVYQTVLIVHCT